MHNRVILSGGLILVTILLMEFYYVYDVGKTVGSYQFEIRDDMLKIYPILLTLQS
jgi:hypothetical protein